MEICYNMYCENCGTELADDAAFCSNCGHNVRAKGVRAVHKHKNIYIALILTFIFSGLGSIYAGNVRKGMILLGLRLLFAVLAFFINIFGLLSILVWTYSFYEAYKDVEIANGNPNPDLRRDFKGWNQDRQIIAGLIVCIVLILTVAGCAGFLLVDNHSPDTSSKSHYYSSGGSSSSGSQSSHYGGVDTSPNSIVKNDPDWYYDHYEYGDNDKIDEYLESQGYD